MTNYEIFNSVTISMKTRYNKAFRLKIYKLILVYLENNLKIHCYDEGFCMGITWCIYTNQLKSYGTWENGGEEKLYQLKLYDEHYVCLSSISIFKELMAYKPSPEIVSKNHAYWFPLTKVGILKRIKILKTIIAEMEK